MIVSKHKWKWLEQTGLTYLEASLGKWLRRGAETELVPPTVVGGLLPARPRRGPALPDCARRTGLERFAAQVALLCVLFKQTQPDPIVWGATF